MDEQCYYPLLCVTGCLSTFLTERGEQLNNDASRTKNTYSI